MTYNFDEVINRKGTNSLKWDGEWLTQGSGITDQFNEDTLPAYIADMDFKCAQPIIDAVKQVANHGLFGYTGEVCDKEYHQAIIDWFARKHQWQLQKDEIIYGGGVVNSIANLISAYSEVGDGVIIQRPVYGPFAKVIEKTGRVIVNNQLINNNGYYTMNYEELEQLAKEPQNKLLVLCNPHNPVGRVWKKEELQQLFDICEKYDVLIITDEIHGDIIRKGNHFTPLALVGKKDRIITCTSIGKTFNLATMHCANIVIQDEQLRSIFTAYMSKHPIMMHPSSFAIVALKAAYTEGDEWLASVNDYIDGNIEWILAFLQERMPKVKCYKPEGTYIMWMDFSGYQISHEEIYDRIYHKANVVLESGALFDPEKGQGFERICVPTRRAVLEEIFERIARAFEDLL